MKLFISWSGETSRRVALVLREWIPGVINAVEPFVSSKDIHKGDAWFADVADALKASDFCIICLTPDNVGSTWVHFEAGAIATRFDMKRTSAFLTGLSPADVKPPLSAFQHTSPVREDVLELLRAINGHTAQPLSDALLARAVDKWWGDLEEALVEASGTGATTAPIVRRDDADLLTEVLDLGRRTARTMDELVGRIERLEQRQGAERSPVLVDAGARYGAEQAKSSAGRASSLNPTFLGLVVGYITGSKKYGSEVRLEELVSRLSEEREFDRAEVTMTVSEMGRTCLLVWEGAPEYKPDAMVTLRE